MVTHALAVIAEVAIKPNPNGLPGAGSMQKLIDGLAFFALLACAAGLLLGAALYSFGSRSSNFSQAANGRSMMLYAAVGAFVAGAAPAIINFFQNAGGAVK